jgi:hypothetical protein
MTERALLRLYLQLSPVAYRASCIFHESRGCTLDRSMRADVCNSYFCRGLGTFPKSRDHETPTVIIAGEGEKIRTSPVLMP